MAKDKELTTAQLQAQLDELLAWFESDQVDLDQAVTKYQQGTQLVAQLQERLKTAQNTIKKISKT
jgi:exodeoxyribonuclease VII small subunit